MSEHPMVVIAGRPNVGKSSLVNRIVGSRAAVVEEEQGVTRDRKVLEAEWGGVPFSVMDTGGWLAGGEDADGALRDDGVAAPLGVADPTAPRVAIIGRPNVGKSTLFNRLLGEERSVVHDMPGTTRDAIDTVVETPDGPVCFIDTAGLRRPSKTDRGTETHATMRALRALERADVAILVIDATVGASHQDQRLAERIGVSGCPAIVALNKWDLVAPDDRDDVLAGVGDRLAFLGAAPVLKISARSGKGVHRLLPALHESVEAYHQRVPTGALNRAVQELQARQPAPRARVRYAVQGAIDPPTFTLFTNARLPQTYLRYLERGLREKFDLGATPLKLRVRVGGK